MGEVNIDYPEVTLEQLHKKVEKAVEKLTLRYPDARESYEEVRQDIERLGVLPHNTYLYIQGHHLFNHVVLPLLERVCSRLMREREIEIGRQSLHNLQYKTEISAYRNSVGDAETMLKKNLGYMLSTQYNQILEALKDAGQQKFSATSITHDNQNKTRKNEEDKNR